MTKTLTNSSKKLAAIFFIPRQQELSIRQLLQTVRATDISLVPAVLSDRSGLVSCTWAGMSCQADLQELPYHHLLQIYFWQSSFLELLPENESTPVTEDGTYSLAQTFKFACEVLAVEVGFILTHLDQVNRDFVLEREWMVLAQDANRLADERFGLLYLNAEISQYWTHNIPRDDRDILPVASGKLVFANKGIWRWF